MFDPSRLTVSFAGGAGPDGPLSPRRYTYTHSDRSGRLFLTIGADYDRAALRKLQARLERDEVLGEWVAEAGEPRLELHMQTFTWFVLFGTPGLRRRIFRHYRPLMLAALRHGDAAFIAAHPELDVAEVVAVFHGRGRRCERESWGALGAWRDGVGITS